MGLVAPALYADQAVLIPELLRGLPFEVFAASSIDALVHAVESALSPKATEFSKLLSYKAAETIIKHYETMAREGREARHALLGDFLLASNYAGIAFGTAGCAAVHALSYPLGGAYHVPHGESNYAVFTGVMKNYLEIKTDGEISKMMDFIAALLSCEKSRAWDELEKLLDTILPKKPLRAYGVKPEDLPRFTEAVMTTQQRLIPAPSSPYRPPGSLPGWISGRPSSGSSPSPPWRPASGNTPPMCQWLLPLPDPPC